LTFIRRRVRDDPRRQRKEHRGVNKLPSSHDRRQPAMSALVRIAAWAAIIGIGLWLVGGPALRLGGATSLTVGLPFAADAGSIMAGLIAVFGGLVWLAGHWLFAARNHYYRSPLARRVFLAAMPRRLAPTRDWGLPTIPPESRR
jgi:hypothetical protein